MTFNNYNKKNNERREKEQLDRQALHRKNLANKLFKILKKEDLSEVHSFMKDYLCYEGIDAYCPECDKIYCWEHYNARVEYDDGFYDCTCGECPAGHLRMIDD